MTPSDPPAINPSRLLETPKSNTAFLLGGKNSQQSNWENARVSHFSGARLRVISSGGATGKGFFCFINTDNTITLHPSISRKKQKQLSNKSASELANCARLSLMCGANQGDAGSPSYVAEGAPEFMLMPTEGCGAAVSGGGGTR